MIRPLAYLLCAVPLLCGADAHTVGVPLPAGYRDWPLISIAHEAGNFNDLRAILGNEVAVSAFRKGERPFPDGTIIARLAWRYESSPANDAVFGRAQSFVAGAPTNVQLMIKDSTKYAATDGWGFAQFNDGKPVDPAALTSCFPCHRQIKDRDLAFSHYSP